jgi:hypothetical protein
MLRIPPFLVRLPVPTFTTISFEDMTTLLSLKMHFSYKAYQEVGIILQFFRKKLIFNNEAFLGSKYEKRGHSFFKLIPPKF